MLLTLLSFVVPLAAPLAAKQKKVWINKRAPVFTPDHRRKWQEFYQCHCGCVWWAWSSDRPPSNLSSSNGEDNP